MRRLCREREKVRETRELSAHTLPWIWGLLIWVLMSSVLLVAFGEPGQTGQDSSNVPTPTASGHLGGWEGHLPWRYTFRDLCSDVGNWESSQGIHLGPTSGADRWGPSLGNQSAGSSDCLQACGRRRIYYSTLLKWSKNLPFVTLIIHMRKPKAQRGKTACPWLYCPEVTKLGFISLFIVLRVSAMSFAT